MTPEIPDPVFAQAVGSIDAGDTAGLDCFLAASPRVVRDRLDSEEGYFRRPFGWAEHLGRTEIAESLRERTSPRV